MKGDSKFTVWKLAFDFQIQFLVFANFKGFPNCLTLRVHFEKWPMFGPAAALCAGMRPCNRMLS